MKMNNLIKLFALILMDVISTSCGRNQTNTPEDFRSKTKDIATSPISNEKDIYTKYEYADNNSKKVIIENSRPRGGTKYTDSNGKECSYAVFFTRIINETDNALELNIDLPKNSYEISNFPGKYFEVLIPADTMTLNKIPLFSYGLTDIESFLDNNIHKPSSYKRTINPKESSGFYFVMFILTLEATGMTRTGLSLKGQDLFYKISRHGGKQGNALIDEIEIHCGSINLKNLVLRKKQKSIY